MELVPDSRYRVKIQTVNEFGRSHWSKDFEFDTYGGSYNRKQHFSNLTLTVEFSLFLNILLKVPFFQQKRSDQVYSQLFHRHQVYRQ